MNIHQPPIIHSADNPIFKKLMALQAASGIRKHSEFLIGGPKIVTEVLKQKPADISAWIAAPDMPAPPEGISFDHHVILSNERFKEVNCFGAPGPLLAMRAPQLERFRAEAPWPAGCTLFVPFGDPENVGGVLRAAAGLGAARVVLLREAACPFLPKAIRASAGAAWKIRMETGPVLAELSAIKSAPIFALDMQGELLESVARPNYYGLVAGMEGQGLPEELRRNCRCVSIPMANGIESLNAAMSIAIALWAWR